MATVAFPNASTITNVASAMTDPITLASGTTRRYAYLPTSTSNGRGASFWISHDGTTTAAQLSPMTVKWDDRAAVQGYCNPQWAISITGPITYVIDCSNDTGANYTEFV